MLELNILNIKLNGFDSVIKKMFTELEIYWIISIYFFLRYNIIMVSVIDENFEYFECFDGEDAISTEIKIYLSGSSDIFCLIMSSYSTLWCIYRIGHILRDLAPTSLGRVQYINSNDSMK